MHKLYYLLPLCLAVLLVVGGCDSDEAEPKNCEKEITVDYHAPVFMALKDFRASTGIVNPPQEISAAGKIYIQGNYIFVNEPMEGIHIINNQNPGAPVKVAFIKLMGNVDMAVKGNILYADSFCDLVVFDITNPLQARKIKTLENVLGLVWNTGGLTLGFSLPDKRDSLVVSYKSEKRKFTRPCDEKIEYMFDKVVPQSFANVKAGGQAGKGGSMARITIANNYLYTVDASTLRSFNIQQPESPVAGDVAEAGRNIETIFPYGNSLFIGSANALYIYSLANPAKPEKKSTVTHFTGCDPVVVENNIAYVTIRTGATCRMATRNELLVFDVKDISNPVQLASYEMKNPHGLGIDKGRLFICEGDHGLRFLNAANPKDIKTTKLVEGMKAYDVIPWEGADRLLLSAVDGIYQYSYSSMSNPALVSKITVKKTN